jgi:hypothetical protein
MNPAETLLAKKMLEAEPLLDIQGPDQKLFQVAYQDFTNYIRFSRGPSEGDAEDLDVSQRIETERGEFEAFAQVWVGMWLRKWKSRVKLFLGNNGKRELGQVTKVVADAGPLWERLDCKKEMTEMVTSTLIREGEICGTEIFAQYLLKAELGKKSDMDVRKPEHLFAVLNGALRGAREMALCSGPFMYVKVDKAYFALSKQQLR